MKKITIFFISTTILFLFFADIEINTLFPLLEVGRILKGFVKPNVNIVFEFYESIINTLIFAFCGMSISVLISIPLSFLYGYKVVQLLCSTMRSIHEIFWFFILLPIFGLYPLCGVLAIAVPCAGILAKGFYEIFKESHLDTYKNMKGKVTFLNVFFYTIIPVIKKEISHFTFYRLECAIKSSAILGFIGLPTIGFHLESFFKKGMYSESAALLLSFYAIIALLKIAIYEKIVPFYCAFSFWFISKSMFFSWENVVTFFTYEIIPWPMRRDGFINNTNSITFKYAETIEWLKKIIIDEGVPGAVDTIILTQIAFTTTGVLAIILILITSKHFINRKVRCFFKFLLIIMRTTPEYFVTYIFIQLLGPSMLPAIIAISLYNGAIVSYLTLKSIDVINFPIDVSKNCINKYFYEVLPRIYGIFLSNLFYRWEIMVRESSILGILGIYTIGFYVDSAMADDKMDKVLVLIILIVLINSTISAFSSILRKRIKKESVLI